MGDWDERGARGMAGDRGARAAGSRARGVACAWGSRQVATAARWASRTFDREPGRACLE